MALRLEETAEADLPAILAIEADPDVAPWIERWPAARHLRAISAADEAHLSFLESSAVVGFLLLAGLTGADPVIELRRIALGRRGAGLGAAALDMALEHGFEPIGARRVWLDVLPDNKRALRLYERAGFSFDGAPHQARLPHHGPFPSLRLMSIGVEEWASRRAIGRGLQQPRVS